MKFNDAYDNDGGVTLEVIPKSSGAAWFRISVKEGPRRWRREELTLSKQDVENLSLYLAKSLRPPEAHAYHDTGE